uniref:Uncharacterized protein n=1 Tax=Rhizophora mucronata TaxID=61149 RepID=A0A2P2JMS4_RHIMU
MQGMKITKGRKVRRNFQIISFNKNANTSQKKEENS